jgi:hypothetical protein
MKTNRVGEYWTNNDGEKLEIIEYKGVNNCTVRFEDGTVVENVQYHNIISKNIKNNNRKSVFGVGFIGYGNHKASVKSKHTKCYSTWKSMLMRCYYKYNENNKTYEDVEVDEDWHSFQEFAEWYLINYIEGWELDKDLLNNHTKIYSKNNCCFLPKELNILLKESKKSTGTTKVHNKYKSQIGRNKTHIHIGSFNTIEEANNAYKLEKKKQIVTMAEKYKEQLNSVVYNKLINYEV